MRHKSQTQRHREPQSWEERAEFIKGLNDALRGRLGGEAQTVSFKAVRQLPSGDMVVCADKKEMAECRDNGYMKEEQRRLYSGPHTACWFHSISTAVATEPKEIQEQIQEGNEFHAGSCGGRQEMAQERHSGELSSALIVSVKRELTKRDIRA